MAKRSRRVSNSRAQSTLTIVQPVPGVGELLTPSQARRWISGFADLMRDAREYALMAETQEERSAIADYQHALVDVYEAASSAAESIEVKVDPSDWAQAHLLAIRLRVALRSDSELSPDSLERQVGALIAVTSRAAAEAA